MNVDRLFQRDVLAALAACRGHFAAAALFSLGVNVLYLAAPIYLLQVYDRVLASGNVATLVLLTLALLLALATLAALDYVRAGVLSRSGLRLENRLAKRVMAAMVERASGTRGAARGQALRDLDAFRQFVAGGGINALFDAPWVPIFILAAFLIHPLLGVFTIACALVLIALALFNQSVTREPYRAATDSAIRNYSFTEASLRNAEAIQAMGMLSGLLVRWGKDRERVLKQQLTGTERNAAVSSLIRFLRMFMQSLTLGIGAWLVIERSISPGQMFAATILLARALQPIEQAVSLWRQIVAAYGASARLGMLLAQSPAREPGTPLPRPAGALAMERVSFQPAGAARPILHAVQFALAPGQALGVIGPTAAGKSTLARLIVGIHAPSTGAVRLDGASVYGWERAEFGRYVGYLPQDIELFAGTVGQNISRFGSEQSEAVVWAAKAANAHEMILRLPSGYETEVGEDGVLLSPGQRQRIALARALFGEPALVVLDEPNSNLDNEGDQALVAALAGLKRANVTVVVVTHRGAVLGAADRVLALQGGAVLAFGPPAEVMASLVRVGAIAAPTGMVPDNGLRE